MLSVRSGRLKYSWKNMSQTKQCKDGIDLSGCVADASSSSSSSSTTTAAAAAAATGTAAATAATLFQETRRLFRVHRETKHLSTYATAAAAAAATPPAATLLTRETMSIVLISRYRIKKHSFPHPMSSSSVFNNSVALCSCIRKSDKIARFSLQILL